MSGVPPISRLYRLHGHHTPIAAGRGRSALYRNARSGAWSRIARGIYLPADVSASDWDQLEAVTRRPEATVCLISALVLYDLTDEIPELLDVAIPRGKRAPVVDGAIRWHRFDPGTFELGRERIQITGSSHEIGIYSPERTIADCFRLRASIGYEITRDATKEWLRRGGKPAVLMQIAAQLSRTKGPVLQALEMMA